MGVTQNNLFLAWLWILVGILSGLGMGMFFQKEEWLGGYASFRRRLYRLGHISFFGLALLNLAFVFTVRSESLNGPVITIASWGFLIGAIAMPLCCAIVATLPNLRIVLFSIPVTSLLAAAAATLWEVAK
jgi:hypothetical protein